MGAAELGALRQEFPGDGLRAVAEMFQEESLLLVERIAASLQNADALSLRRAAHALWGAAANFGARPLQTLCQEIEACARRDEFVEVPRLLGQLREEYRRAIEALQEECRSTS